MSLEGYVDRQSRSVGRAQESPDKTQLTCVRFFGTLLQYRFSDVFLRSYYQARPIAGDHSPVEALRRIQCHRHRWSERDWIGHGRGVPEGRSCRGGDTGLQ